MSDILIKNMKMPENCYYCALGIYEYPCGFTNQEHLCKDGRPPDCPLVEVPPHGMLIDVDKLEKGCFYGVGTDGVFYKLYPRIKLPLAKKINVETGEIIYPTNADRFRAKSDEELAKTLSGEEIYPWCTEEPCKYDSCTDCVLAWLKQEVSNDK